MSSVKRVIEQDMVYLYIQLVCSNVKRMKKVTICLHGKICRKKAFIKNKMHSTVYSMLTFVWQRKVIHIYTVLVICKYKYIQLQRDSSEETAKN